ncbi:hypothetical protein GCM10027059_40110 [Myceligenerans halotolerans]
MLYTPSSSSSADAVADTPATATSAPTATTARRVTIRDPRIREPTILSSRFVARLAGRAASIGP